MTGALLYQPKQNWRIAIAFVGAALIHFAAVAIAGRHHQEPVEVMWCGDAGIPVDIIQDSPLANLTPPPDDTAVQTPLAVPVEEQIFTESRTTPPPVRKISKPATPIVNVASGVTSGTVGLSSIRTMALSGPRPAYPYEARRQKITGSGVAMMTVDPVTGNVIDAVMQASTGSSVLDNAAVSALRRWRFKAGTRSRVRTPITFTLTGAQY